VPIAIVFGGGAESRRSLGLAVVDELLFSQLVKLYVTPNLHLLFHTPSRASTPIEIFSLRSARLSRASFSLFMKIWVHRRRCPVS